MFFSLFAIAVVLFFFGKNKGHEINEDVSETPATRSSLGKPGIAATKAQAPSENIVEPIVAPKIENTPDPMSVETASPKPTPNEWKLRNFDLPKPNSLSDLMSHLTPPKRPLLPISGAGDGSVLNMYRGYYKSGKDLLRIVVDRPEVGNKITSYVSIEDKLGASLTGWSEAQGQINAYNYENDPYSLILLFADGRVLYLKWAENKVFREGRSVIALHGWLWSSAKPDARCSPVAVVSLDIGLRKAFVPGSDQNEADFPAMPILEPLWLKCPTSI